MMKFKRSQRQPESNREHGTVVHECARSWREVGLGSRPSTVWLWASLRSAQALAPGGLRVTHAKGTLLADTPTEFAENVVPMVRRKKCLGTLKLETPFAA